MESPRNEFFQDEDLKDIDFENQSTLLRTRNTHESNERLRRKIVLAVIFHLACLSVLGITFALNIRRLYRINPHDINFIPSPARQAIRYEVVTINNELDNETPFKGEPSPTLDALWDGLEQCMCLL